MIGRTISRYQVAAKIGEGAMGVVYRAQDTTLQRTVALKFISPHALDDPAAKARFLTEARAAAALNHPNICTIYEVDEQHGFLAMEYVDGQSLQQKIGGRPLPVDEALDIAIQIGQGLEAAHEKGIVHRDIKPANVLLTSKGVVKITDFGLALIVDRTRLTTPGAVAGTPAYMAPEQIRAEPVDRRTDLWGLGVILCEMLTGAVPIPGHSGNVTALSAPLQRLLGKALAISPTERYQHAAGIVADLRSLRHASGRRVLGRRAAIAAVIVSLIVVTAVWFLRRRTGFSPPADFRLLSSFPGSHREPTASPDGSLIAFISDASGSPQVWIKQLAEGEPVQITSGSVPASRPRWSPKNDQIFFARRGQGIWSAPPLGGAPRQILSQGFNPNISSDGEMLVYEVGREIWIAKADGAGARRVDVPEKFYSLPSQPAFSPDGRSIVYFQPEVGPNGDFWIVSTAGGAPRRLTFDTRIAGDPVWMPDGRSILCFSERRGSHILWAISVSDGAWHQVTTGAGEDFQPAVSANGKRIVYTNARNSWTLELADSGGSSRLTLLDRRAAILWPRFSASGDEIAFFHQVEGDAQVFSIRADGSHLRQVTTGRAELNAMPRWAPDGSALYFYQDRPTVSFRRVPIDGGPSIQILPWSWKTDSWAEFDPSGKKIAYTHEDNNVSITRIRDAASGQEHTLSLPVAFARWSRDGKWITGNHAGSIHICNPITGDCKPLTKGSEPVWSGDDSRIFFFRAGQSRDTPELWSIATRGGDERRIGPLGPFRVIDVYFDLSARGQIVWAPFHQGRQELWLAELP